MGPFSVRSNLNPIIVFIFQMPGNPKTLTHVCFVELNSPLALRLRQTEKKPRSIDDGGNLSSRQRVSELRGSLLRQFVVKVYKTGAVRSVLYATSVWPPREPGKSGWDRSVST